MEQCSQELKAGLCGGVGRGDGGCHAGCGAVVGHRADVEDAATAEAAVEDAAGGARSGVSGLVLQHERFGVVRLRGVVCALCGSERRSTRS